MTIQLTHDISATQSFAVTLAESLTVTNIDVGTYTYLFTHETTGTTYSGDLWDKSYYPERYNSFDVITLLEGATASDITEYSNVRLKDSGWYTYNFYYEDKSLETGKLYLNDTDLTPY